MREAEARAYWQAIHEENAALDVSWYQEVPEASLALIEKLGVPRGARVLDVGCGQRGIAGALIDRGFENVSALDVAPEAIRRAREEIGLAADRVTWIEGDVLSFRAPTPFDVWHDRALLHFFLDSAQERDYASSIERNLASGGLAIVATFAPDGPEKCSGLPVHRHDASSIGRVLGPRFTLVESFPEMHMTPWGTKQSFEWAAFRRT